VPGKPIFAWGGLLYKVVIPMFSSPLLGFAVALVCMSLLYWAFSRFKPGPVNRAFRRLQIFSSACMGFSHGSNDAQKTMGILALALFTATKAGDLADLPPFLNFLRTPEFKIPLWVKFVCAATMAAGTASGGRRIIKTLGRKVTRLQPVQGFAADMSSATVLMTAAEFGMPVSTTHVVSASIMGVGTARNVNQVRLDLVESILWTWFLTLPASALVAYSLIRASQLLGFNGAH
jgi:inorganic phosphate transporter, PiT family